MGPRARVAILSSIITAALVYAVLEWRSGAAASAGTAAEDSNPGITFAAPFEPVPAAASEPPPPRPAAVSEDGPDGDERNNIEIYRRYSRSVVNVASTTYSYTFFFSAVPETGFGSGVVIDDEGHIVTNYHVIQDANAELVVTLADRSRHGAVVVGVDPRNDLALIRVDAGDVNWVPLPMGTTRGLQVGRKVLAIGNPFGLDRTLTTGIVSSLSRAIAAPVADRDIIIEGVIQTDAAINQGNSGGPLLDTDGELIGINTAIVSGATGIGFAIPVETVRRVTGDLLTYGRVRRAYLGIDPYSPSLAALGSQVVRALGLGTDSGVLVTGLAPGGPAEAAGIRGPTQLVRTRWGFDILIGGDVIVSLDERDIRGVADISAALEARRPGDVVPITVVRDGARVELEIELQEEPVAR